MATQLIKICLAPTTTPLGTVSCDNQVWAESYVVTPETAAQLDLLINGGFDADTYNLFFWGTVGLFIVGFTTGIIISQLRKMRR